MLFQLEPCCLCHRLRHYAAGLASSGDWRLMLGLSAIPAVVQGIGMLWMPESPLWLEKKGLHRQAQSIMVWGGGASLTLA